VSVLGVQRGDQERDSSQVEHACPDFAIASQSVQVYELDALEEEELVRALFHLRRCYCPEICEKLGRDEGVKASFVGEVLSPSSVAT